MISRFEHSDEAPPRANNQVESVSRHTGFSLNQSKQIKNLVKDAMTMILLSIISMRMLISSVQVDFISGWLALQFLILLDKLVKTRALSYPT